MNRTEPNAFQILIVDDVNANLKILRDALEPEGYSILGASNGEAALKIAKGVVPDLVLLDVLMPGINGYEVCRELKGDEATNHIPVIFVTVQDDKESILQGFWAGGVDYVTKPYEKEEVLLRVKTHLEIARLTDVLSNRNKELEQRAAELVSANQLLQEEISRRRDAEIARDQAEEKFERADERLSLISRQETARWGIEGFVGRSEIVKRILDDVRALQDVERTSVLISGESGTGKELIARAIHFGGTRSTGAFITVNCSAVPRELAESAFFGHRRGAFTGAHSGHRGYFELADGGTLFLDEIGDMALDLQAKLLRAIETGSVTPVGSTQERQVDVRMLAATNQDLRARIAKGAFREDLFFRLARFTVDVPPLRERPEDIPLLAEHFLALFASEMGILNPALTPEALALMENYPFPGNVRELKNIIEHALIKSHGSALRPEHLRLDASHGSPPAKEAMPPRTNGPMDRKMREELVIQRAQPRYTNGGVQRSESDIPVRTDEERIMAYVRKKGSMSNPECRDLLSVDLHRASYLLKKLHRYGLLEREGSSRWARYRLPPSHSF